jgi:1,4-dihydroxy-2-naphthoyl-CoA hydrolase
MPDHPLPPFARSLGMTLTQLDTDGARGELLVDEPRSNSIGIMHGGAIMTFGDTLGALSTIVNLPAGMMTSTLESKTNFLAPIRLGDRAYATCTPLHLGSTTMVWQTAIRRSDGKLAAIVTQTQLVFPRR